MAYTPYGGGDGLESALDARDLTGEGMTLQEVLDAVTAAREAAAEAAEADESR